MSVDLTIRVLQGIRDDMRNGFAAVNAKLDENRAELAKTNQRLDANTARLDGLDTTLKDIGAQQIILGRYVKNAVVRAIDAVRARVARLEDEDKQP
jgi:hypothetical protein